MSELQQGTHDTRDTGEALKKNETAPVDWAEKLKASMNQSPDETPAETPEYDDLAALLRAQLNKSESKTASAPVVEWNIDDIDDFDVVEDEEDEEDEESAESEATEDDDELEDDSLEQDIYDESFEDLSSALDLPSDLDLSDEIPSSDPIDEAFSDLAMEPEEIPDELTEEFVIDEDEPEIPVWTSLDEPIDDRSVADAEISVTDSIDAPAPDEEFVHEEESPTLTEDDYDIDRIDEKKTAELLTKEILDRAFGEEFVEIPARFFEDTPQAPSSEPDVPARRLPRTEYRRPASEAWTDDRLNGGDSSAGSAPLGIGGDRLRDLALENQRLMEESERQFGDFSPEGPFGQVDGVFDGYGLSDAEEESEAEDNRVYAQVASVVTAPLQLGLDDISPTVQAAAPVSSTAEKNTASAVSEGVSGRNNDYTARMAHNREKEAEMRDTDLFMRLGYEEALRRTDEQSRVEKLHLEADEHRREETFEVASVRMDEEYRGRKDTTRVEKAYARGRQKNAARLVIATVGVLIGLLYDLAPLLLPWCGDSLDALLGTAFGEVSLAEDPYYYPMGLLWILLICLPFLTRLVQGGRSLLNFEPTRYAVAAVALPITLVVGGLAWFVGDPAELPMFAGGYLVTLWLASLSELWVTEGEYRGFSAVSAGKSAYILTDEPTSASIALDAQKNENNGAVAGKDTPIFSVVKTGRVADYFARTQRYNPYMGKLNVLLPMALLMAILCAGAELAMGGDMLTDGVRVFLTTYLICLPATYLISMTIPLCYTNTFLRKKGAAIIGTAAPTDYAAKGTAHLIYSDGDALKALHRMNITLKGDPRSDEYRRIADVVFRLLNIPLAEDPILREEQLDHYRIEISERGEQYLRLYLVDSEKDSATEIMMGSHNALTRRGVRLPRVSMEKQYKKSEGCHVMYLAFNRNFHLAYGVEYRVGRTFGHTVAALNDLGYEVDLATYDPMFDPSMDGLTRLRRRNRMEVLRPGNYDVVRKARSSGLVVTGRSLDLLYPLSACRSMLRAYRLGYLYSWLCLPVSAAFVMLTVYMGWSAWLTSAVVAAWLLVSGGVTLGITLASTKSGFVGRERKKYSPRSTGNSKKKKSHSARR